MESNSLFPQSCRICSLEYENGINVFGDEGKKLYLQAKIRKYLYITISMEDKLPKMICENCCKRLESIHKFATMAIKIQDKFNKLVASSSNFTSVLEPKKMEAKGLLHTYLTKGIKDNNVHQQDIEVTEMEVRVDPMLVLQYALDEDEYLSETESETDSQASQEKCTGSENTIKDTLESNTKPFFCFNCPRRFTSESALQTHMWCHFPKTRRVVLTNSDNVICDVNVSQKPNDKNTEAYEKVTSTQTGESNLAENGSAIRFTCPICSKVISTKGNLKVHLETHRPKGKYACDICGRIFKTQCNLHRHKEYHEGIQFPCAVCGRVYPTNSTLRAHSITHSDLRPHKCPLCDKTFKRNQDLKFHINQHTGARPYQCPYCPKAFASSGNCFSHRKRMHPLEVERDRERAAKIMR